MGRGNPTYQPTKGSGERHELPHWGPGRSPDEERVWSVLSVTEHFCLQDIVNIGLSEIQNSNNNI